MALLQTLTNKAMKTVEVNYYKFHELPKTAQQRAIENLWDINVDYGWWEFTYDDAEDIGCRISGFDLDRGESIDFELNDYFHNIIDSIKEQHGKACNTYKLATEYEQAQAKLVESFSNGINTEVVEEGNEYDYDKQMNSLEESFREELANCYLSMLHNEYEYLTSEKAIKETILANDYYFEEYGNLE